MLCGGPYAQTVTLERRGVLLGASAYLLWGLFPLYFPLLEPAGAGEVLAHRILWSLLVVIAVLLLTGRWARLSAITARQRGLLAMAAVLLSVNWLTYVYAVLSDQVIEASLGYFINPLVTVALGVALLGERLSGAARAAVLLASVGVVVLTVSYGRLPWIALVLAFSFALYGLLKKQAGVAPVESLGIETAVLILPAAAFVLWSTVGGTATFGTQGWGHGFLMLGLGVVTAIPLLLFGAAATSIPLVTLGLLQYITPILQFLIGWAIFHESMPATRWLGFGLVWVALMVFSADTVRRFRSQQVVRSAG